MASRGHRRIIIVLGLVLIAIGGGGYVLGRPGQPVCSAELKSNILRFNLQEPDSL